MALATGRAKKNAGKIETKRTKEKRKKETKKTKEKRLSKKTEKSENRNKKFQKYRAVPKKVVGLDVLYGLRAARAFVVWVLL